MALLVDVSSYQGHVDWNAVIASGRAGAIVKATEGVGYVDPTFKANWAALGAMSAVRGCYHFARPDVSIPEAQADRFLAVVGPTQPGDILVLDLEAGNGDLSAWALGWLQHVEARTTIRPWLYSYGPFIRAHLTDRRLARYPLWLAAYSSRPPTIPAPWTSMALWQRTDKAVVPGIGTPCDESTGDLNAHLVIQPTPTPPSGGPDMANIIGALVDPQVPGGVWVFARDGGVFAFNGARYLGSFPGLPPEQRQGGPRTFSKPPTHNQRGGYDLVDDATPPELYSFP